MYNRLKISVEDVIMLKITNIIWRINMKKILTLMLALIMSLAISIPAYAETEVESAGNIFMFEESISKEINSKSDVYAMGESVNLSGTAEGDILALGRDVTINESEVKGSIRCAGSTLNILATSVKNITVAGATITVKEGTNAKGVYIAGGSINFLGNAEDLYVAGEDVTIDGTITGDIKVDCRQLTIGENAKIEGTIKVKGEKEPIILGDFDSSKINFEKVASSSSDSIKPKFSIGSTIIKIISSILIALLLVLICRRHLEKTTELVTKKAWLPLVIGFCTLIVLPIVALLTFITIVGIPIGVLSLIIYGIVIYLAPIITAIVLGKIFIKKINIYLSSIAAVVVLRLLLMIPILGVILTFACIFLALGAFVLEIIDRMKINYKIKLTDEF